MTRLITILLLIGGVGTSIYYFQYHNVTAVVEENEHQNRIDVTSPKVVVTANEHGNKSLPSLALESKLPVMDAEELPSLDESMDVAEAAFRLQKKKAEVENLMREFNANLSDPVRRKEIQGKMDHLMVEYNALALPVALKRMSD